MANRKLVSHELYGQRHVDSLTTGVSTSLPRNAPLIWAMLLLAFALEISAEQKQTSQDDYTLYELIKARKAASSAAK